MAIAVITQINPVDVQFSVPQDRVPDIQARAMESVKEDKRLPVTPHSTAPAATCWTKAVFLTLDNQIDVQTGTVRAKARFARMRRARCSRTSS
jgi:multidrug efflux system membrane fusion protein